ncbi:tRNA dimethylallyltransferase [Pelagirhabdus alkalitolerans]|uniref:tRNA dimethylallyltransferase n=1 Tax=Pelagirhabdus alkalitolerans TaxID=1612202 RepID=A0A1G6H5G6_9BACI|nr:tRNA (adenosine(37)-N6)-dimethylallyltransferase MiaA [Pelagirhabdus alkalitolerans]SDB89358.1 tRNA dimethylallyltransferase [Pelagirhabdus alkalitolerans]
MKKQVIAIVGPTAVGKTELSIQLAKRFNGEIISGDSMQIYKGMDIATAKITDKEKESIPHHMIDIKEPNQSFSVAEFKERVQDLIDDITSRGKQPIIVGGTGLYIQAALWDYHFSDEEKDPKYREKIEQEIEICGIESIFERLETVDPKQAEKIHPNNIRRVVRALEVYDRTGKTKTEWQETQPIESPYQPVLIGLTMERSDLYARINARVDQMVEEGIIEEAKSFYQLGFKGYQSMKAIGYKEFIPYFEGDIKKEEAIEQLKQNSRRYAKRQYTWFKNKMSVNWYDVSVDSKNKIFQKIYSDLEGILDFS